MSNQTTEIILKKIDKLEEKFDKVANDITEIKIKSAKRESKYLFVMGLFGLLGGALADFAKKKFLG